MGVSHRVTGYPHVKPDIKLAMKSGGGLMGRRAEVPRCACSVETRRALGGSERDLEHLRRVMRLGEVISLQPLLVERSCIRKGLRRSAASRAVSQGGVTSQAGAINAAAHRPGRPVFPLSPPQAPTR